MALGLQGLSQIGRHRRMPLLVVLSALALMAASCESFNTAERETIAAESRPIARALAEREDRASDGAQYSIWLGEPSGRAWFQHNAGAVRPAASAIKTGILIEFFGERRDMLDAPFDEIDAIVTNPSSPAIAHFSAEQKSEARKELPGLTSRQLGEAMIHKKHVTSNAAYNAAANIIIEYLGGPEAVSERIRRRFPDVHGLRLSRYMLADRHKTGDNLLSAEALAQVLESIAGADEKNGLFAAARQALFLEEDETRGIHYYKGGTLTSHPQARIEAGWWENDHGAFVYVVIATRPKPEQDDFEEFRNDLGALSLLVQSAGANIRDSQARAPQ